MIRKTDKYTTLETHGDLVRWALLELFERARDVDDMALPVLFLKLAHWLHYHMDQVKDVFDTVVQSAYERAGKGSLSLYEILRLHDYEVEPDLVFLSMEEASFLELPCGFQTGKPVPEGLDATKLLQHSLTFYACDYVELLVKAKQTSEDVLELPTETDEYYKTLHGETDNLPAVYAIRARLHTSVLMGASLVQGNVYQPLQNNLDSISCKDADHETQDRSPKDG